MELDITAYDASYVYLALKFDEPLVTDDKKLIKRVRDKVSILTSRELIRDK